MIPTYIYKQTRKKYTKMESLRQDIVALHVDDPRASKFDGHMLWLLYDDGELSSTKGGQLFGLRSHHLIRPGQPTRLTNLKLPLDATGCTFAIISSTNEAIALCDRVQKEITKTRHL
jgi:hypothetical protein